MKININLPKIGLRNLKTAIAVMSCILIFQLFNLENPFFACIAAVFCMRDTVSTSIYMGINRTIGTIIGGIIGIVMIYLNSKFPFLNSITPVMVGLAVSISIYLCTIIQKPEAVVVSCVVIITIMLNSPSQSNAYIYAIRRSFDTILGIIIAVLINKYINPPSEVKV